MRTSVYLDYQNIYHSARRAFHDSGDPPSFGQVLPLKLAELLCRKSVRVDGGTQPVLNDVRLYRGMPRPGERAYSPARRQVDQWRSDGVHVITRPLSGPRNNGREKGIDIALALDFFETALTGSFELGILFSVDSDFEPLIERVLDPARALSLNVETAAWWAPPRQVLQLGGSAGVYCNLLSYEDYETVRDTRNYMAPRRGRRR